MVCRGMWRREVALRHGHGICILDVLSCSRGHLRHWVRDGPMPTRPDGCVLRQKWRARKLVLTPHGHSMATLTSCAWHATCAWAEPRTVAVWRSPLPRCTLRGPCLPSGTRRWRRSSSRIRSPSFSRSFVGPISTGSDSTQSVSPSTLFCPAGGRSFALSCLQCNCNCYCNCYFYCCYQSPLPFSL